MCNTTCGIWVKLVVNILTLHTGIRIVQRQVIRNFAGKGKLDHEISFDFRLNYLLLP